MKYEYETIYHTMMYDKEDHRELEGYLIKLVPKDLCLNEIGAGTLTEDECIIERARGLANYRKVIH